MATDYYFICHCCKKVIELGDLNEGASVIHGVLQTHGEHNYQMGESSDFQVLECQKEYKCETVIDYPRDIIKPEYSDCAEMPVSEFHQMFKRTRVSD